MSGLPSRIGTPSIGRFFHCAASGREASRSVTTTVKAWRRGAFIIGLLEGRERSQRC